MKETTPITQLTTSTTEAAPVTCPRAPLSEIMTALDAAIRAAVEAAQESLNEAGLPRLKVSVHVSFE